MHAEERADLATAGGPRPPAPYVARPRLDALLDAVPSRSVTLLVGPAGTGKTAAAAAWVDRASATGLPVAWARGDHTDRVAVRLEAMRSPAWSDGPTVVVIDEIERLDPRTVDAVADLLTRDPDATRLLLVGRRDPGLVPIHLTLAGRTGSARGEDLRFDDAAADALVRAIHPDATAEVRAAIVDEAGGWAAALVLGAHDAASRQPAIDHLQREVVDAWPEELTTVLLATCQEAEVTGPEATLLSGLPDAADHLERAAGAGLFVHASGEHPEATPTWHLDPLLRHLLRQRTAPTGSDWPVVVEAHRRAAAAYADLQDGERALRHARLSGDLDLQLRLLQRFAAHLLTTRHVHVVEEALDAVPLELRSQHVPLLALGATVLRIRGQVEAAKAAADRALAAGDGGLDAPLRPDTEALLATLELWQARYGWREAGPALTRAARVLGCRHDDEVSAHDLTGMSPTAASWLTLELAAFEVWLGQLELAAIHVQDAVMYAEQVGHPVLTRAALAQRAVLEMVTGGYQNAAETADRALGIDPPGGPRGDKVSARLHLSRGWGLLVELRLDDAEAALAAFDATPHGLLDPLMRSYSRLLRACVLTARGDAESARRLLDGRGDVPELLPAYLARLDRQVRLVIAVAMGDLATVSGLAGSMRATGHETDARFADALRSGLTGEEQRAVRLLSELLPQTVDGPLTISLGSAVSRVALLQRIGTPSSLQTARDLVPDLLTRAAPQRAAWLLALGTLVSGCFGELLGAEAADPDAHPYAPAAAAAVALVPHRYPEVGRGRAGLAGTEDARALLTVRELEVLEQLALGGGNADLARALFVSENTVKTHLASIYRKLEVDRRVDALRVARAHGLL